MRESSLPAADAAVLQQMGGCEMIDLILPDLNGLLRGKRVTRDALAKIYDSGVCLPMSLIATDITGNTVEETNLGYAIGDEDRICRPVPGSLRPVPWQQKPMAQLLLSMEDAAGGVFSANPREVLKRVLDRYSALGLTPVVAVELEFYLLDAARDTSGRPQPARLSDGGRPDAPQVYGVLEVERLQPFFDDLYRACEAQGLPLRTAISEYAPGQLELTLEHRADALQAVDEGVRYKRVVKGVAARHGCQACFMAKPFADRAGSGLHLHVSLADRAGNNLYASEDPTGTPLLRHSIGGMLRHLRESLALFAPHANSYRRFQANSYAPAALSWGINNRTVSLRVPGGPAASRHVEHRICGADANPYLAAAAVLAGLHSGIREQIDPGDPIQGNGYAQDRERLPTDWLTALRALESSAWAREAFGEEFIKVYLAIKHAEMGQFMSEVGEQDWRWYLVHA